MEKELYDLFTHIKNVQDIQNKMFKELTPQVIRNNMRMIANFEVLMKILNLSDFQQDQFNKTSDELTDKYCIEAGLPSK